MYCTVYLVLCQVLINRIITFEEFLELFQYELTGTVMDLFNMLNVVEIFLTGYIVGRLRKSIRLGDGGLPK